MGRGTYEPQDSISPDEQLARGKIDIVLKGEKLRGGFTLIQTGKRSGHSGQRERWLLIEHRDEHADLSWDIEALASTVLSSPAAASGRSQAIVIERANYG